MDSHNFTSGFNPNLPYLLASRMLKRSYIVCRDIIMISLFSVSPSSLPSLLPSLVLFSSYIFPPRIQLDLRFYILVITPLRSHPPPLPLLHASVKEPPIPNSTSNSNLKAFRRERVWEGGLMVRDGEGS
jgi:hypothetical protein